MMAFRNVLGAANVTASSGPPMVASSGAFYGRVKDWT